jgi:hypothetical protein
MPSQKKTSRRKRPITKRSSQLKATSVMDLATDISHSQSSTAAITSSSSLLKRYEDVIANDQGTSFAPTLLIRKKPASRST